MSLLPITSVSWWNGLGLPYSQLPPAALGVRLVDVCQPSFPVPMPFTAVSREEFGDEAVRKAQKRIIPISLINRKNGKLKMENE